MGLRILILPTVRSASEHATGQSSGMDLMVPIYPRALPGILNPDPIRLAFFLATAILY